MIKLSGIPPFPITRSYTHKNAQGNNSHIRPNLRPVSHLKLTDLICTSFLLALSIFAAKLELLTANLTLDLESK